MKPKAIKCSDELRDELAKVIKAQPAYHKITDYFLFFRDETLQENSLLGWDDHLVEDIRQAIFKRLWVERDQLSPKLQKEIQDLDQDLIGVSTGYGKPLVHLTNLPEGIASMLAASGLLSMAAHPGAYFPNLPKKACEDLPQALAELGIANYRPSMLERRMLGHQTPQQVAAKVEAQPVHRDTTSPSIIAFGGIALGDQPATTGYASVEELIDETARHYRELLDGTPHDAPLADAVREKVCELLSRPLYKKIKDRQIVDGSCPVFMRDPRTREGQEWPQPWRIHPNSTMQLGIKIEPAAMPAVQEITQITDALQKARMALKTKDDFLINPGEVVIYNNELVLHAIGREITNEKTDKSAPRIITWMNAITFQQPDLTPELPAGAYNPKVPEDNYRPGDPAWSGYTVLANQLAMNYWNDKVMAKRAEALKKTR